MRTSPRPQTRSRPLARGVTFVVTLLASILTSTAVAGLDPAEPLIVETPATAASAEAIAVAPAEEPRPLSIPPDECSAYLADFCVEVPMPAPQVSDDEVLSCVTGTEHSPTGSISPVPARSATGQSDAIRVRIEVEEGLAIDRDCFAGEVMSILNDPRGWAGIEGVAFAQVDDGHDLRLILTSPERTDSLCYPARTVGRFSCRKENKVILNLMRWESGTDDYKEDLPTYRTYLVNHEVGHFLGRGHLRCPGPGEPAPVMMQQTKGLGDCLPNGWPTKDES